MVCIHYTNIPNTCVGQISHVKPAATGLYAVHNQLYKRPAATSFFWFLAVQLPHLEGQKPDQTGFSNTMPKQSLSLFHCTSWKLEKSLKL